MKRVKTHAAHKVTVTLSTTTIATAKDRAYATGDNLSSQLDKDLARVYSLLDVTTEKIRALFDLLEIAIISKQLDRQKHDDHKNRILIQARIRRLSHIRSNLVTTLRDEMQETLANKIAKLDLLYFWALIDLCEQQVTIETAQE